MLNSSCAYKMGNIVEITGVPGVGKTTLANALAKLCNDDWCVYSDEIILRRLGAAEIPDILARAISDLILFIYCLRAGGSGISLLIYAAQTLLRQGMPIGLKFRVFGNMMRKLGRTQYIQTRMSGLNVILDEGIGHIPFNLQSYDSDAMNDCVAGVYGMAKTLICKNVLVVLDESGVDECDRLLKRGHDRTHGKPLKWVERFCSINRDVIYRIREEAKGFYKEVRVVRINNMTLRDVASKVCV